MAAMPGQELCQKAACTPEAAIGTQVVAGMMVLLLV